jgi:hypothetical protein
MRRVVSKLRSNPSPCLSTGFDRVCRREVTTSVPRLSCGWECYGPEPLLSVISNGLREDGRSSSQKRYRRPEADRFPGHAESHAACLILPNPRIAPFAVWPAFSPGVENRALIAWEAC